jgi:formylglycine-generating enzyme required for sulfatase activity
MTAMTTSSASGGRSVRFLLREPRQTQGFLEALRLTPSGVAPFETLVDEAENTFDEFMAEELEVPNQALALSMLWIPPGRFWMGSPPTEPERGDTEGPMHLMQMQGFFMSQTPITQAQWRQVVRSHERPGESWGHKLSTTPSSFQGETCGLFPGETNTYNRPVEQVSWLDAMEFCSRLSQRTGRIYTLPSEAQWEYACRAGTTTPFHFGNTINTELANYNGNYDYADGPKGVYRKQTTPVGLFPANAWGLQDMHGNMYEWCLDEWHDSYEGAPTDGGAWVDGTEVIKSEELGKARLLRGGSWDDFPRDCRSAFRSHYQPDDANDYVGFRVVCLPQGPSLNP